MHCGSHSTSCSRRCLVKHVHKLMPPKRPKGGPDRSRFASNPSASVPIHYPNGGGGFHCAAGAFPAKGKSASVRLATGVMRECPLTKAIALLRHCHYAPQQPPMMGAGEHVPPRFRTLVLLRRDDPPFSDPCTGFAMAREATLRDAVM